MKRKRIRNFLFITLLITGTGAAMAYSSNQVKILLPQWFSNSTTHYQGNSEVVKVTGQLIQSNVLQGSEGTFGLSLTLQADDKLASDTGKSRNVDMVIVLDRSGSMKGRKLNDARKAVIKLLSNLTEKDRFALVTYSDGVQIVSNLQHVDERNRTLLVSSVQRVRAGGGTNLGSGLQAGIDILTSANHLANAGKIILISDGLANKGITDAGSLGNMAGIAVKREFAVSTVGVGAEFNEHLMTTIADHGTGYYYYLENPEAFAEVFEKEFYNTQTTAVSNLAIYIPVGDELALVDASGYPVHVQSGYALFYPGTLRSGQTRQLFLTLRVPTDREKTFTLDNIIVRFLHNSQHFETSIDESLTIACTTDRQKVRSSIDKLNWTDKVLKEDYNRLKQNVAADIRAGKKQTAIKRIENYYSEQEAVNEVVGSAKVTENLDKDINELRTFVEDTFHGAPEEVRQKQKSNAKALQYEGYSGRRN